MIDLLPSPVLGGLLAGAITFYVLITWRMLR
jgi:hypothetical protein